ncbi:LOW QUALITY PROTEIN: hypothetical protein HZS_3219 [Henneguya salminicola]|nr:LOW QUALITY PROTEIN: hypothetical protein HZS_3219 [Henneguya salminicola]
MYNCNGLRQRNSYICYLHLWILTRKNEYLFSIIFQENIVLLEYNWSPKLITVDLDMTPFKPIRYEFSDIKPHGCSFDRMNLFIAIIKNFYTNQKKNLEQNLTLNADSSLQYR